jgi:phospholipase/carboxylesterase
MIRSSRTSTISIAGCEGLLVGSSIPDRPLVIFLHGFGMLPSDIAPFAAAVRGSGTACLFPRGTLTVEASAAGRAEPTATWWPVNVAARARAAASGPTDLSQYSPPGVQEAFATLDAIVDAAREQLRPSHLIVGGFSQGAMLAIEWQLQAAIRANALAVMSGTLIRAAVWEPRLPSFRGMPIFQSHGERDPDLGFDAALRLRDLFLSHGASVRWQPFDGGHEMTLAAWRAFRAFIREVTHLTTMSHRNPGLR